MPDEVVPDDMTWSERVEQAYEAGYTVIAPNNLPIRCIGLGKMMENEHADHVSYLFPVSVEWTGEIPKDLPEEETWDYHQEDHALIYSDRSIALTVYECCYCMWNLSDGLALYGSLWKAGEWRLSAESLVKIRARFP